MLVKLHKTTWRSNDGRTNNQIDDVLIDADGRHSSSVIGIIGAPYSDINHILLKAKLITQMSTDKQTRIEIRDLTMMEEKDREKVNTK